MTGPADPYRTLGLAPGASENEIRSAYRRLVKQVHPDRAGERMLPRFLAVQAAYEALVDGEGHLRPRPGFGVRPNPAARPSQRPGDGGGGGGGARTEPGWRADPDRARATREAYRARRASKASGAASGNPGQPGNSAAGGAGAQGAADSGGAPGGGPRRSAPRQPGDAQRHGPRRATHGSTSYDDAHETPFEPDWSGGSWYGETSGTFWTVNPREYADPRKHGPEYQARARRRPEHRSPVPDVAEGTDAGPQADHAAKWPQPPPDAAGAQGPDLESLLARLAPERLLAIAVSTGRRGRLLVALAGWPPVGWALATVLDALTGCGTYAARCTPEQDALVLVVQPLVVLVLFALPAAAAMAAFSAMTAIAVGIPAAVVLSAGTLPQPAEGRGVLVVVATLAYVAGAAVAARRLSGPRPGTRPPDDPPPPPPGP